MIKRIGIDLAKDVFQIHGVDSEDQKVLTRKLKRREFLDFFATKVDPNCLIGMEACASAHHWARQLIKLGFIVKLIPPQYVKPYVKRNKNDANDAEAICEAVSRPTMSFVPVKTLEQQDIQSLHRVRCERVKQRTAIANQIRGLAAEYGIVAPLRLNNLRSKIPLWLEDAENGFSIPFRAMLNELNDQLKSLDNSIKEFDRQITEIANREPACRKLQTLPGVGPITATALYAAIGDGTQFSSGRQLGAWLGLTPRQHSSGGKEVLMNISKRGNAYLRTLFIHGARSAALVIEKKDTAIAQWFTRLATRRPKNVAVVALANKNARIAWAILTKGEDYREDNLQQAA
ncbi:MAG TPA: IS110 family transposase [Agitococcus sp.]|nr:IS110 family transposase [Agitococcus sp.]